MKLYEVPAGSKIKVIDGGAEVYKFYNIDGMYSYCEAAWTEVEVGC